MKSYTLLLILGLISAGVVLGQGNRKEVCLDDSSWRFMRANVPDCEVPAYNDSDWLKVEIPHDWNGGSDGVHFDVFKGPGMYLGVGCYRSRFVVPKNFKGKQLSVQFRAVSLAADVWLNGRYLGQHKGGYTAFSFKVTPDIRYGGENILVVKASNANDSTMAPWMKIPFGVFPNSSDYAVYGGIYRDVDLLVTDNLHIVSEHHTTSSVSEKSAIVNVRTSLQNSGLVRERFVLKTTVTDTMGNVVAATEQKVLLKAGTTSDIMQHFLVNQPELWYPGHPYIYRLHSEIIKNGEETDGIASDLGFRWYILKNGTGFVLNGKHVFLHGVNLHQDRQGYGYAITNKQRWQDIALIKSLGFNFIRHAHYPCDETLLNACDKLGIMVWLEIPVSTCIAPNPAFLKNAASQLSEMIRQHSNHPCVIVWGLGNESDRSGASTEAYTNYFFHQLNALAHAIDSTRPTTGCNYMYESNQRIPDVYAPQDWTGWYSGNYHQYNPKKLIGEYGADSQINSHDEKFVSNATRLPWTQESACLIHEYKASKGEMLSNNFPGQLTWVAFDFASPRTDRVNNPIPYMNQKGLVLYDHKTLKDVAYFYRSFYTSADKHPMVYIVSHTWTGRIRKPGNYNIWAYSNCDSVELFNDYGKTSLGIRIRNAGPNPQKGTRFEWFNAPITGPVLYAVGIQNGKAVAGDTLVFTRFEKPVAKN